MVQLESLKYLLTFLKLPFSVHLVRHDRKGPKGLELITFDILAAERLRLVGFDNRLVIDCFANVVNTRQSKHCRFSIYIFDNSKSIMKKVKINSQVGQGKEDALVWSGLC